MIMLCGKRTAAPTVWDTWKCGCEKVSFTIDERPYISCMECYCDDCVRRMRICKAKYEKPAGAKINQFSPGGGYMEVNAASRV